MCPSGVPLLCQAATIKERFAQYGDVLDNSFFDLSDRQILPTTKPNFFGKHRQDVEIPPIRRNKTKRIAFVSFAKKSQAKAALEEDEAEFEGSTLKARNVEVFFTQIGFGLIEQVF